MIHMGRPRKHPDGESTQHRSGKRVSLDMSPDLMEALELFRSNQRIKPTKTDTLEVSLQEFLKNEGYYPPAKSGESLPRPKPQKVEPPPQPIRVPIFGDAGAGSATDAEPSHAEFYSLDWLTIPGVFLVKVRGNSMRERGILDGDYAIVRVSETANPGDLVVCFSSSLEDGHLLKKFTKRGHKLYLESLDGTGERRGFDEERDRVVGVYLGVLRRDDKPRR